MKVDLTDTSFLIALKIDSQDRINNLDLVIDYLKHHFDTEIIISEQGPRPLLKDRYRCTYVFTEVDEFFNRQRGVNIAARHSNKPIIAHYDADIVLTPAQILKAVEAIRSKELELVIPYNGEFYDIPKQYHAEIKQTKSTSSINLNNCIPWSKNSVGGAVFFNRDIFWKNGGANENFKGLGYEDNEIFDRFRILKTKMGRVTNPLLHLNHVKKETAYDFNPYVQQNADEYVRISRMTYDQLQDEISNWGWLK